MGGSSSLREEARAWLEKNLSGPFAGARGLGGPGREHEGFELRHAWERHLGKHGWTCPAWPERHGGRAASLEDQVACYEEYARADAPARVGHIGEGLIGPTILEFGTDEQKDRFLPAIQRGDEPWRQGYSEPDTGLDVLVNNAGLGGTAPLAMHPLLAKVTDERLPAEPAAKEAFRRAAEPWEVANVIVFLASDYSSYMTGEVISVSSQHPWSAGQAAGRSARSPSAPPPACCTGCRSGPGSVRGSRWPGSWGCWWTSRTGTARRRGLTTGASWTCSATAACRARDAGRRPRGSGAGGV